MDSYIIYNVKTGKYLAPGSQTLLDGSSVSNWSERRAEAIRFSSVNEAKAVVYQLEKLHDPEFSAVIYQKY